RQCCIARTIRTASRDTLSRLVTAQSSAVHVRVALCRRRAGRGGRETGATNRKQQRKALRGEDMSSSNASGENTRFIILISLVATIGGFLFGYESGVINGTVDGITAAFDSDAAVTGFNVASMLLGCAVGAWFAGTLADRYGRRTMLLWAAVFFIVSAWG